MSKGSQSNEGRFILIVSVIWLAIVVGVSSWFFQWMGTWRDAPDEYPYISDQDAFVPGPQAEAYVPGQPGFEALDQFNSYPSGAPVTNGDKAIIRDAVLKFEAAQGRHYD